MARALRRPAQVIAAVLTLIIAYEAFAVVRAHSRTPAVLKRAATGELALADLTPERRAILLKVDDPGFLLHHGLDFSTPGQGKTNLTQALVKIFYFDHFKPGFAKIEQSLIARFVLDPAMSKDDQLRAFLNHARFGTARHRQIIGFADASRTYYGRRFTDLDRGQFIALVAMLMAPNRLDPLRHPNDNAERVRKIEALLAGRCAPAGWSDDNYDGCKGL